MPETPPNQQRPSQTALDLLANLGFRRRVLARERIRDTRLLNRSPTPQPVNTPRSMDDTLIFGNDADEHEAEDNVFTGLSGLSQRLLDTLHEAADNDEGNDNAEEESSDDIVVAPSQPLPPTPLFRLYRADPEPLQTRLPHIFQVCLPSNFTPVLLEPSVSHYTVLPITFSLAPDVFLLTRTPSVSSNSRNDPDRSFLSTSNFSDTDAWVDGLSIVIINISDSTICLVPGLPVLELVFGEKARGRGWQWTSMIGR